MIKPALEFYSNCKWIEIEIPFYKHVQAGYPKSKSLYLEGWFGLNDLLIFEKQQSLIAQVTNSDFRSMGISKTDYVIFHKHIIPSNEDLVLTDKGGKMMIERKKWLLLNSIILATVTSILKFPNWLRFQELSEDYLNSKSVKPKNDFDKWQQSGIDLDEFLICDSLNTSIFEVRGKSMLKAGIRDKDIVIVNRNLDPKSEDIVVAKLRKGYTVKRYKENELPELHFEHPNIHEKMIITPENKCIWEGVVTTIIQIMRENPKL